MPTVADGDVRVRGRFSPPVLYSQRCTRSLFDQRDHPVPVKAAPYTEAEPNEHRPLLSQPRWHRRRHTWKLAKRGTWKAWSLPSPFSSLYPCPYWPSAYSCLCRTRRRGATAAARKARHTTAAFPVLISGRHYLLGNGHRVRLLRNHHGLLMSDKECRVGIDRRLWHHAEW